jgi:uncharacterized membrane protein
MDRVSRTILAIAIGMVVLAALLILIEADADVISVIGAVGVAVLAVTLLKTYKMERGEVLQDERTRTIHNRAMGFSWWLTYLTVAVTFLLDNIGAVKMSFSTFSGVMIFAMLFSYLIVRKYLSWRGEG